MKMKLTLIKKILFYIILFFPAFLLISCNDKPSDLAVNLLPDTVKIETISTFDTVLITGKQVYMPKYPIFNTGAVFIGRHDDLIASTLLNFAWLPDTLGNLKEDQIESVVMNMFPERYAYGDTIGGSFGFDIYQVTKAWRPDSTTYDSLFVSPANYFGEKITSWDGKIELKDTIDKIQINLPAKLIIEWLKTEMKLDSATNTMKPKRIPNWGLAFIPKENSNVVHRFIGSAPNQMISTSIIVTYKNTGQDTVSYLNLLSGVDVTYLKTSNVDTNSIVVQNGLNYWTKIDFDLTMIPKFSGIHKAQFELTLDPSKSRNGNVPLDSVLEMGYFIDNQRVNGFTYYGARESGSNKYIFSSITSIVQYHNKYGKTFTLELMPNSIFNQARELERLTFYGLNATEVEKRPQLKVIYSLNPAYLEPQK